MCAVKIVTCKVLSALDLAAPMKFNEIGGESAVKIVTCKVLSALDLAAPMKFNEIGGVCR